MRFARAKGSKASNERVPETATSWRDMKSDMLTKNEETESKEGNSKCFKTTFNSNVEKQDKITKWSEFPFDDELNEKAKLKSSKKQKVNVEESEHPLVEQKKKKRKLQANNSGCSEETFDDIKMQGKNDNNKKRKLNKKSKKNVQLIDYPDSKVDATGTVDDGALPNNLLNTEFNATTNKKHSKKLKQLEKKQKDNFSDAGNVGTSEKKSFNKKSNNAEHKRHKPNSEINKIYINGNEVEIAYYDGFPIKKLDAERLKELKKEMITRGLPRSEIAKALKLERRKAEKSLAREKKKVCFNCRKSGHTLSECPMLNSGSNVQLSETGICFKCGSTEHTHFECRVTRGDNFKFAQCFICKEQGHIARQCPDNNKGLYPKGGACRICGDVTHLKKDCPKYQSEQEENKIVVHTIDDDNIESLENESIKIAKKQQNSQKIIKF